MSAPVLTVGEFVPGCHQQTISVPTTPRGTIDPQRLFRALANLGVRSDQNLSAFAPWRPSVTVKAPNRFGLNRRVSGDGQSAVPAAGPYLARGAGKGLESHSSSAV